MADIGDKVVAITGASSGIGEATARLLAARGAAVVLGARRTERLDDIARDIVDAGGRAEVCATDVTRREDLERLVGAAVQRFGRLDVLVNNAGVARLGMVDDLDVDGWSAMIDVNVGGVLNGIAAAVPVFRSQGHGHLVTTLSTSGLKITPTQAVYAGTKNAVRTLLEGLRQESTDGVLRTTSISPGMVRTEFSDLIAESWTDREAADALTAAVADLGMEPEAVARAIAFAIEQPSDVEVGDITIRPTRQG
ncbi:SDR family oxidoreductase [Williamsia maris]|uniref:NADP-dependent 3-hydroxy acid dehydrogenase YdfG n=1 Tax=Williamsia maris TaxID=72806 RepID=A0ABT1HL06_9NOCA|nr:SDR family oxidoreductase [Williamsia maris]MCP2178629.1 NADP-dependent 3-hydroxy acid dehydrogenase YdfG [Williamsia maris]